MRPPNNEWLEIVKYYMFHDVPRLILVKDPSGRFWIFECPFDEQLDDYSNFFSVCFVGVDLAAALADIEKWGVCPPDLLEATIPIVDLQFDSTKRKACMIIIP